MGAFVVLIACAIGLAIHWYLANQFLAIAEEKGFNDRKYLWICFWLGVAGWIMVCALPDRGNHVPAIFDELPDL